MAAGQDKVRWMGTPEWWADVVALCDGLETVAFWQDDDSLDVETGEGRRRDRQLDPPAHRWRH